MSALVNQKVHLCFGASFDHGELGEEGLVVDGWPFVGQESIGRHCPSKNHLKIRVLGFGSFGRRVYKFNHHLPLQPKLLLVGPQLRSLRLVLQRGCSRPNCGTLYQLNRPLLVIVSPPLFVKD